MPDDVIVIDGTAYDPATLAELQAESAAPAGAAAALGVVDPNAPTSPDPGPIYGDPKISTKFAGQIVGGHQWNSTTQTWDIYIWNPEYLQAGKEWVNTQSGQSTWASIGQGVLIVGGTVAAGAAIAAIGAAGAFADAASAQSAAAGISVSSGAESGAGVIAGEAADTAASQAAAAFAGTDLPAVTVVSAPAVGTVDLTTGVASTLSPATAGVVDGAAADTAASGAASGLISTTKGIAGTFTALVGGGQAINRLINPPKAGVVMPPTVAVNPVNYSQSQQQQTQAPSAQMGVPDLILLALFTKRFF